MSIPANINSIEEGIISTNASDKVQPAPSRTGRVRYTKIYVSLAVIVVKIVAVSVVLSTRKKQEVAREANSSLIVGGTEAFKDRYPYIVAFRALQDSEQITYCGGSMITKDVVLTAAHCDTYPGTLPFEKTFAAVVGRHASYQSDGEVISVKSILPHPEYDGSVFDLMLVFLDHAYTVNNVDLVALNSDTAFPCVGQEVKAMGWGDTYTNGTGSGILRNVNLNIVSDEECALTEAYSSSGYYYNYQDNITDWEHALCAVGANQNGKDTCQGDSGGPLVVSGGNGGADIQVGVVSWGIDCGRPGIPGIYSEVSTSYDWIRAEVCKGSVYASEAGFDCSNIATTASSSFAVNIPTYSPSEGGTQWVEPIVTKSPTYAPTEGSTPVAGGIPRRPCLTQQECYNRHQALAAAYDNYYVGNFGDNYGCFSKGGNMYWGEGGTEEQLWDYDFTGEKQSVLCYCVEVDC